MTPLSLLICAMNFYAQTHHPKYNSFDDYPIYEGTDLGLTYSVKQSIFKVYSPAVKRMTLYIYKDGHTDSQLEKHLMTLGDHGVWEIILEGDYQGKYYNFQVRVGGRTMESCLLYTSPSPRDQRGSRMPSSA